MKQKKQSHLRGQRGQAFADRIRGIHPEQILCVSIDISKDFHVVLLHNGLGEIITPSFEIDIFRTGFERLCQTIDTAVARAEAQTILIGMEPTGHYYENLARHLHASGYSVTMINSYAVKENRRQHMMAREKNDEIDAAAIGDLLRRGEGTPYRPLAGIYLQLQQLDRARLGEVKIQTMYKNRIIGHLDRIWPGLILTKAAAKERYQPLFATDFWECQRWQQLVRVCPDPREVAAMSPQELRAAFHEHGFPMGPVWAKRFIVYAQRSLWADPEVVANRRLLLTSDLAALDGVSARIDCFVEQIRPLLAETPYQFLTRVKGLAVTSVASFAAAVGDPAYYNNARQVFRRSGLVSGQNDSGTQQRQGKGSPVTKAGDVYLRRALNNMFGGLVLHQPVLSAYYHRLKQTKKPAVARVATIRRFNGILWATVRDQRADTLILKKEESM
jgi:transposase